MKDNKISIQISETTTQLVMLAVENNKLRNNMYDTLQCLYGDHIARQLFEGDFSEEFERIDAELIKLIGSSVMSNIVDSDVHVKI